MLTMDLWRPHQEQQQQQHPDDGDSMATHPGCNQIAKQSKAKHDGAEPPRGRGKHAVTVGGGDGSM